MHPYEGFLAACRQHPDAPALEIGDQHWTYAALADWVARVAALLRGPLGVGAGQRVGVLASRSLSAYGGSLAVLASGATLVALNPAYPVARNLAILQGAGIRTLLVGEEGLPALAELAAHSPKPLRVLCPQSVPDAWPAGVAQGLDSCDLTMVQALQLAPEPAADDLAYLVFTSGSTGEPKGVAISHHNLAVYMRNFRALAAPQADDRVASSFELTFDVALHDLLNSWWSGATLVVMGERHLLAPARFILDQRITVWFSVASFAMLLQKQGLLRPGLFDRLRTSMLCGEALPCATAAAWAAAAPNSVLYNVYGPTETTMELAFYRWDGQASPSQCRRGLVPIGVPFADHVHLLLDEQGREVPGAGEGELYLSGPQVGPGYWGDAARSADTFVQLPGRGGTWYRTGDRVERDALGCYHFISRVDLMVKLRGHRIELGEVEHALRRASGVELVAVVPRPAADGLAQGLVGFVCAPCAHAPAQLRDRLAALLPKAWLPDELRLLSELPLNANRKIDRGALAASLVAAA